MLIRPLRSPAPAVALLVLALVAVPGCTAAPGNPVPGRTAPTSATGPQVTPVTDVSADCPGNSSEVEEAFAPPDDVYAEWIGCGSISVTWDSAVGTSKASAIYAAVVTP